MDFFNSPEIVENDDEDVDMFAELGVINHAVGKNVTSSPNLTVSHDPLAAFMDDDDLSVLQEIDELKFEADGNATKETLGSVEANQNISEETIAELLEVLVKKELQQREEKGVNWLTDLPGEAKANIDSAKVIKDKDAYHLSLIIDMIGTGPVRPFATVSSNNQGTKPHNAPESIPAMWIPLYNVLRDLLMQAMNLLSSTRVGMNYNA
mgnify:CR=1 FL=1|tara:strand:- start:786 stop:1409 length:624 start_codon:yes stop_codon:yes gene_type:complete